MFFALGMSMDKKGPSFRGVEAEGRPSMGAPSSATLPLLPSSGSPETLPKSFSCTFFTVFDAIVVGEGRCVIR